MLFKVVKFGVNFWNFTRISQDLTKNKSKIAYLARQAVKQKQIKSTSIQDGKIFITDKADNRKIIACEDELL
jgi:uncharacterized protein YaeQ